MLVKEFFEIYQNRPILIQPGGRHLLTSTCIFYILLSIVSSGCGFAISLLGLKQKYKCINSIDATVVRKQLSMILNSGYIP